MLTVRNIPGEIERTKQLTEAVRLRAEGKSYQAIADAMELGSRQHAHQLVKAALEETRAELAEAADDLRALETDRLDRMHAVAWDVMNRNHLHVSYGKAAREVIGVHAGPDGEPEFELGEPILDDGPKLAAIRTLISVAERRARLLGLDSPVKIEANGELKIIVEGVDLGDLT
jgi:hypothetical protein